MVDHDFELMRKAFSLAWSIRDHSRIHGCTKVGAAAVSATGQMVGGCNVEHRYRSHDIHAEQNAIGNFVSAGLRDLVMIVIVADRERFTPCGGCLDWIIEVGGFECKVGFQGYPSGPSKFWTASELMPFYPK